MPGGKSPKVKGDEFEREVCRLLRAERTYWQPGQKKKPDCICAPYLGAGECKRRRNGFTRIYKWLEEVDFLAVRDDHKPMLVILRARDLGEIIDELDELKVKILKEGIDS